VRRFESDKREDAVNTSEKRGLLSLGPRAADGLVHVIVEIPAGSRNKFATLSTSWSSAKSRGSQAACSRVRLLGTIEAKIRPTARSIDDLPAKVLDQIEHSFVSYNRFEGREFIPTRRGGPAAAQKRLDEAIREHGGR
jgi:inorganic pyrophosphatase